MAAERIGKIQAKCATNTVVKQLKAPSHSGGALGRILSKIQHAF
jgi:hypothetical protein